MVTFWIFAIIVGVIAAFFLILTILVFIEDRTDEPFALVAFLFVVFGIIESCILFNVDYTVIEGERIYPSETNIMFDDEEVIVKWNDYRWEKENHKEYTQILDSNFHIQSYKCYNVFGMEEPVYYQLVTFDEEEMDQENETAIPIEL